MVATLQSRKEALQAKIKEKNEELKKLCIQEAELTGIIPPEIPLEPGESPPQLRRRIGTSFSFPQNLINSIKSVDDESLTALELECKVQTNIAEAALLLANDTSTNKAVRRKHRLVYRQSQRHLMELETRMTLLRQGKSQVITHQHVKKKPRPIFNSNDQANKSGSDNQEQKWNYYSLHDSGPMRAQPGYSTDEVDNIPDFSALQSNRFGSLHRSRRSSAASRSSGSPRIDGSSEETLPNSFNSSGHQTLIPSQSQPNIQGISMDDILKMNEAVTFQRRSMRRGTVSGHWDTMSAGGTLLPSQTYPEHSHHPNLSRTQSLGSVETNAQRNHRESWSAQDFKDVETIKEKEWYETSLDSAPSPPLRTSSRLPPAARLLYNLKEAQIREAMNLVSNSQIYNTKSHHTLVRTNDVSAVKGQDCLQTPQFVQQNLAKETVHEKLNSKMHDLSITCREGSFPEQVQPAFYNKKLNVQSMVEQDKYTKYGSQKFQSEQVDLRYQASQVIPQSRAPIPTPNRDIFVNNQQQIWDCSPVYLYNKSHSNFNNKEGHTKFESGSVIINIPEDSEPFSPRLCHENNVEISATRKLDKTKEVTKPDQGNITPTQPYYHVDVHHQYNKLLHETLNKEEDNHLDPKTQLLSNLDVESDTPSLALFNQHPPHAITQNEVVFDTVVPFESPQNHTVIQAGKWQPYREVTKPFEMSDFYKYSTKFRQSKTPVPGQFRSQTPLESIRQSPTHHKGVYQPLRPMTCQPLEYKNSPSSNNQYNDNQVTEISAPEIV